MKINSNTPSLSTQAINKVKVEQEKSLERLASGLKINSAADDVAGFQIAQRLFTQASGLQVAIRNANDAYSIADVAEVALESVGDATNRVNELSLQAANGALTAADRQSIQFEITQLQQQVSDVQANTSFAGQSLFASSGQRDFQVGVNAGEQVGVNFGSLSSEIDALKQIDVTSQSGAQNAVTLSQQVNQQVTSSRSLIGAFQNRISSTISNLTNVYQHTEESRSRVKDTDYAKESAKNISEGFKFQSNIALSAQANSDSSIAASLLA